MKIEITDSHGKVFTSKVTFPTEDGMTIGEPVVCIETESGCLQISKWQFFKVYRKYLKELCDYETQNKEETD